MMAAEEIIHSLAILDDTHPPISAEDNPIRHIFQVTWLKFKKDSSEGTILIIVVQYFA